MWKLCIEDDEGGQTVVPIIRDEITIGRQEGNTIRLTERNVSRRHAKLVRRDGMLYLEEIDARYGIRKNGSKIAQSEEFTEGDVFVIGDYRLTLQTERPKGAPAPSSARPPIPKAPPGTTRNRSDEGTEVLPALPAKLVIISSNFAGQEFPLARKEMLIGRGDECDIIIDHRSVSNKHAKITRDGTTYQIVDLNSKNGLRIGGERYTNVPLKRGDVVELGHVKFRFVEPGENYIFTPQSIDYSTPSDDAFSSDKKGPNIPVIAGVAIVAALLIGGLIYVLSGGGGEADPVEGDNLMAATSSIAEEPIKGDTAEPVEEAEDPKVDVGIEEAAGHYEAGDIEKAIGSLDGLSKYSKPSARQKREIGDLTSKAKLERPNQQHYIAAKADVEKEDWAGSYQSWREIPTHSIFKGIGEKEGIPSVIAAGLMALAQTALEEGELEDAENYASDAVSANAGVTGAADILAEVKRRQGAVAKSKAPKKSDTDSPRKVTKRKVISVDEPELTREEARQMANDAQSKIFQGDASGAISMCKKALSAKAYSCYRIMGVAYKQRGDVNAACKNFKKALRYEPTNKQAPIKTNMESLGCP